MIGLYLGSSCFMIILLTILMMRIGYHIERSQSKTYALVFVGMVELYVLMDALFVVCLLDESRRVSIFKTVVFVFYLVYVIMPYVWHKFMQSYMGIQCGKSRKLMEAVPLIILLGMVICSVPTGIIWKIYSDGGYVRGAWFSSFAVLNLFYYLYAFVQTFYILITKSRREIRYLLKSSVFSALPLIGILVNTYVIPLYGVYPFQPYCLVIGVLLAYLFMVEYQHNQSESEHREKLSSALEQEKEASRKAREAGEVKNTFLANMSHDIRTPMNAILGFSDIIAKHPDDETVVRDAVAKIHASGDILMKIINDVLDLSKIESGKLQVEETVTDLQQLSANLEKMLEYSMEKGGIKFEVISEIENPYVWCDVTKLQQVLVNILNNAVKFTPEGGKITLQYQQEPVEDGRAEYQITVRDTGIGMDEEFQKHAFEAFERERTSTESKIEGTGLGLAIVQKLVDLMDGQVTIHSKRGKGTTIIIKLSLKIADQAELQTEVSGRRTVSDLTGTRILLVEDNDLNAEIATEILTSRGFLVERAENGRICVECLEQAESDYYQIILMDIQMPVMNGYDAAKKIRSMSDVDKAFIPIIAMTANAFEEDHRRAVQAGMDGFVIKPVEVDKLMQEIQLVYEKN